MDLEPHRAKLKLAIGDWGREAGQARRTDASSIRFPAQHCWALCYLVPPCNEPAGETKCRFGRLHLCSSIIRLELASYLGWELRTNHPVRILEPRLEFSKLLRRTFGAVQPLVIVSRQEQLFRRRKGHWVLSS